MNAPLFRPLSLYQGTSPLDPAYDHRGDDFITDRTHELLAGEFSPIEAKGLEEAITQADPGLFASVSAALSEDDFEEAGRLLKRASEAYWQRRAEERAREELAAQIEEQNAQSGQDDEQPTFSHTTE